MSVRLAFCAALLAAASAAAAAPFSTRDGSSGLLDVPDADVLPFAAGLIGAELRFDRVRGSQPDIGPMPLSVVSGTGRGLDLGFSMREWGRPGDPHPSPLLFDANLKFHLLDQGDYSPALALGVSADRFNYHPSAAIRAIASQDFGRVRLAAFGGVDGLASGAPGPTAGLAAALGLSSKLDLVAEALGATGGGLFGGAVRWSLSPIAGLSLGATWLPRDGGVRFSLGVGFASPVQRRWKRARQSAAKKLLAKNAKPMGPVFLDDRPHFRLRLRDPETVDAEPRHLQYGLVASTEMARPAVPLAAARATVKSDKNVSPEYQISRDLDRRADQIDAREQRLRQAEAALAHRVEQASQQRQQLAQREKAQRAQALPEAGATLARALSDRERQLAVTETQYRESEQDLRAQLGAFDAIVSAAAQREATALNKEKALRAEVDRLEQALSAESGTERKLEFRRQMLFTRGQTIAGVEERLSAGLERQDAVERSLHAWIDLLNTSEKRTATQRSRLALVAQRGAAAPAAAPLAPAAPTNVAAVTPIPALTPLPARSAAPDKPAELSPAVAGADHRRVAPTADPSDAEETVLAATVIFFPEPGQPMQSLDREALAGIARAAQVSGARVRLRVRAARQDQVPEATQRAEEVKRILATAGVPEGAIAIQTPVRVNSKMVDVVVSVVRSAGVAR